MHTKLCGQLSSSALSCQPCSDLSTYPAHHTFPNGYLAARYDVSTCCDPIHGNYCLSQGNVRFHDPELNTLAKQKGQAFAWQHLFSRFQSDAPQHVNGHFSVIVIDRNKQRLYMASDRFDRYPLYYHSDAQHICFADRADCVKTDADISLQALFHYFYFHAIPSPQTLFQTIERLPAAHTLTWHRGKVTLSPWWIPQFAPLAAPDFNHEKQKFLALIEEAVVREAQPDNTATFLSGGTDSSTLCGMMCTHLDRPVHAYSIGFDAEQYDEMPYATLVAKHFGAQHHAHYVTADDLLQSMPTVARYYDQPFGNSSAVPAWICAQRAQQDGMDKLLAGDGGDELFAGNARYARQQLFGYYHNLPAPLRKMILEPLLQHGIVARLPLLGKASRYIEQANIPLPQRMDRYNLLKRIGTTDIFTPFFLAQIDEDQPTQHQLYTWDRISTHAPLNKMLAFDWQYTLIDNDLRKVCGTAQLAQINIAFPLLSDELVDFSMTLPLPWKLKGMSLRWFFKEALRGFLPDEILRKKKHGFGLPFGLWLNQHAKLNQMAQEHSRSFAARGLMQPGFVHKLFEHLLPAHPGYYGELIWLIVMLELWLQHHPRLTAQWS